MKISYNWLKDYIDLDVSPEELSVLLTDGGLEVEGMEKVESVKGGLAGVVVGEVLTCEKHPNADKLSITTVDVGGEILPIVCGAPNVAKGQKVPVATVGTRLYSGDESFVIKKSKIRGEVSQGMICAEDELGLGSSHDGIMVLDDSAKPGTPASDYFKIESDYVYEIGLTPNRADATSHIGTARDLVAVLNRHYPAKKKSLHIPDVSAFKKDNSDLPVEIEILSDNDCPRYTGLTIKGITVKDSPDWLKNRLNAVGLRPINNIVDITNFVLMETGHPLHAFDYDKIEGAKVVIRKTEPGTKFITLDEVERELTENDLMICDAEKPMCMAGIFGGRDSGVKEDTKNIFLESAYFNPVTIRKSSKYHGLKTDASFRFERGADPNITIYAIKRAALLIKELAGGEISSDIIDVYKKTINNWNIRVNYATVNKVTGNEIPADMIKSIVSDLEMKIVEEDDSGLMLEVPTFKVDVTREIDVIEEILRVYGYNSVETDHHIKSAISYSKKPDNEKITNMVSDLLVAKGFYEAMNNSLTRASYYEKYGFKTDDNVMILNPLSSELNALRQSLVFGILESIKRNRNFKNINQKLFEFGNQYSYSREKGDGLAPYHQSRHLAIAITGDELDENWKYKSSPADFYSLKSVLYAVFRKCGINPDDLKTEEGNAAIFSKSLIYRQYNEVIAEIGILSGELLADFEIDVPVYYASIDWNNFLKQVEKTKVSFRELPKFPAVRRDLALLVDKNTGFEEIRRLALKSESKLLKSVRLFDVYEGKGVEEGKKSYAVSFIIQDESKTLNDKQIDKIMRKIQTNLERSIGAKLR